LVFLPYPALNVEYSIHHGWVLRLQQGDGNIVNGDACRSVAVRLPVMSVPVQHEVCTVVINHLRQTGTAEKGVDLASLAVNRCGDGE
jgi:hypothetical protein